jgi:hypothetical protein
MQATHEGVHAAYRLGDSTRVTVDVALGPKAEGLTIAALEERWPCRVVGRRAVGAEGSFGAVRAGDALGARDVLVIDADATDVARLRGELAG